MTKNDLTIISKPNAHPHTVMKIHANFHNYWYKTVRVELTRGTNRLYIEDEKIPSSQCGTSGKKLSKNYQYI